MNSKTLILPTSPDSLGLLQALTLLMAGGFRMPAEISLQVCCVNTSCQPLRTTIEADMKQCADNYHNTYAALSAIGAVQIAQPFNVVCFDVSQYEVSSEIRQLLETLWPVPDTLRIPTLQVVEGLEGSIKSTIGEGDVVTFARIDDAESMAVVYALMASVARERLTVVIELPYNQSSSISPMMALALHRISCAARLVLTGHRDDAYRTGFTTMCSLASVAEALRSPVEGEPQLPTQFDSLTYSLEHLPSKEVARALYAAVLMHKLKKLASAKELSSWQRNMQAGSGSDVWTDEGIVSQFTACDDYLSMLQSRVPASGDFAFAVSSESLTQAVNEMNHAPALKSDSLNNARREARCRSLYAAVDNAASSWADRHYLQPNHYAPPAEPYAQSIPQSELFSDNFSAAFCPPMVVFDVCDWAFDPSLSSDPQAHIWRSLCFDLWQVFYRAARPDIESVFCVTEARYSSSKSSSLCRLISSTDFGRTMLQQDIYYALTSRSTSWIAVTSPLTGFAAVPHEANLRCLMIDGHPCFSYKSTRMDEFAARDAGFREFMLVYCDKVGASLSERFRNYVIRSIGTSLAMAQAKGGNIVTHYEQFRTHVGIEY